MIFLGLCDQKSSYKRVSDFGRLRSYDRFFNSRTRPRVNRVLSGGGSLFFSQLQTLVGYLRRAGKGGVLSATRAVHNRAAACVAAGGGIFENQL